MESLHFFKEVIEQLLTSKTEKEEILAANALIESYSTLFKILDIKEFYSNINSVTIDGGVALSSQHAIDCLQDVLRTTRFIKGVYRGILDLQNRFPDTLLQIVYAGSGPAAPLILPLLHLFDPNELSVTILDVNKTSLLSVRAIIRYMGVENYFGNILLQDAVSYIHPERIPLHMIVSETMDKGLTVEPQVRITQNLAYQLHPKGIFIPETISLIQGFSFFSKQYFFDIFQERLPEERNVITMGDTSLFFIDKNISEAPIFTFKSDHISKPFPFEDFPDVVVYAEVHIYKGLLLAKGDSLLSNLYCIASLHSIKANSFRLNYTTNGIPSWNLEEIIS